MTRHSTTTSTSECYITAAGEQLAATAVVRELQSFMLNAPNRSYRLIIGTDSLAGRKQRTQFITALVIHRIGAGGRYFWQRNIAGPVVTLRERMYQEALFSIDLAKRLVNEPALQTLVAIGGLEIHVDIGQQGPTRAMIQEIVGMVTAHGFTVCIKPNAFAASTVADRHTAVLLD